MSNARKCDRCKKFYDIYDKDHKKGNAIRIISNHIGETWIIDIYDLCPDCFQMVKYFLENEDKIPWNNY